MKFLTLDECRSWCSKCSVTIGERHKLDFANTNGTLAEFKIPEQSRAQARLASALVHSFGEFAGALFWATEWGVWPSEENMVVITKFRQAFGEARALIEAPGHLLEESEKEEAIGLLRLALAFGWDAYLIPLDTSRIVFVSHDEFVSIRHKDSQALDATKALLTKHGMKVIKA